MSQLRELFVELLERLLGAHAVGGDAKVSFASSFVKPEELCISQAFACNFIYSFKFYT
jgi:hypothetical protein